MRFAIFLYCLFVAACSTANNWRPYSPPAETQQVQICEQHGSKLYDRATGKECLSREEQRRKDRRGVHHAGAPL